MVGVLIADSQALTREGIIAVLLPIDNIKIVANAATTEQLQSLTRRYKPSVIVVDHNLIPQSIFDLAAHFAPAQLLMISNNRPPNEIIDLKLRGIKSYISKDCDPEELIEAIYATARNEEFNCLITREILANNEPSAIKAGAIEQLSIREVEIVHLIADGLANKDIAEKLFLSVHTIKTHRKNIIKKLGFTFKNAAELVLLLGSLNEFI